MKIRPRHLLIVLAVLALAVPALPGAALSLPGAAAKATGNSNAVSNAVGKAVDKVPAGKAVGKTVDKLPAGKAVGKTVDKLPPGKAVGKTVDKLPPGKAIGKTVDKVAPRGGSPGRSPSGENDPPVQEGGGAGSAAGPGDVLTVPAGTQAQPASAEEPAGLPTENPARPVATDPAAPSGSLLQIPDLWGLLEDLRLSNPGEIIGSAKRGLWDLFGGVPIALPVVAAVELVALSGLLLMHALRRRRRARRRIVQHHDDLDFESLFAVGAVEPSGEHLAVSPRQDPLIDGPSIETRHYAHSA